MLAAGDLKTRGVLQQRTSVSDGLGGNVVTWPLVATLWAKIDAKAGTATLTGQPFPTITYDITIRFRRGVVGSAYGADSSMRFVVGPRIFDIRTVIDPGATHEALVLGCELVAGTPALSGIAVTFTKWAAGSYDPLTGITTGATLVTVTGSAREVEGDPELYAALTLIETESPTLLFQPETAGLFPALGSTVVWRGTTFTVKNITRTPVADSLTAARIVVSR